jgi:O-antigen ligase
MSSLARCEGASINVIKDGRFQPRAPRRFGAVFIRVAGLALAAFLCQSFFWLPGTPWVLKVVVAAIALLAACRPDVALLVLAALVPFGRVISTIGFHTGPAHFTEAIVLAYLAGWLWTRLRRGVPERSDSAGLLLGYLFATVLAASLLVELGILRYWKDYWQPFLGQLLAYFVRDYLNTEIEFRPWADGLGGLVSAHAAALFLEGLALMRAAHVLCAGDPSFGRRLLRTLAAAAVGTAILSVGMTFQVSSAEGRSLLSVYQADRIAVHVTKVNTAASSFVLFLPGLVGLGAWPERSNRRLSSVRMIRWAAAGAGTGLLLTALWMTGSRSALLAGVVVTAGASAHAVIRGRLKQTAWRSVVAVVAACGVVAALLGLGFYMRTAALEAASATRGSLPVRLLMWRAALTILTAHPLFGTGIGQFPFQAAAVQRDEALRAQIGGDSRFDAHNQFLQVAAELGLLGGTLFVAMCVAIPWRAWTAFRKSRDALLGGAIAGVVAFLITCLAGQPLLYSVVAFPFWMVLGVVLAGGDRVAPAISVHRVDASRRLRSRLMTWFLVALALSIPVRVWQGQDRVNFALAHYGFSGWYHPGDGERYRLVRDDGTFFTYSHARGLKLPIRRDVEAGRNRLEVDISLDGRRARTLTLADDEWQTVEFMIPADAHRPFRRIDLAVRAAAGVAAQVRVAPAEITEDQAIDRGGAR